MSMLPDAVMMNILHVSVIMKMLHFSMLMKGLRVSVLMNMLHVSVLMRISHRWCGQLILVPSKLPPRQGQMALLWASSRALLGGISSCQRCPT